MLSWPELAKDWSACTQHQGSWAHSWNRCERTRDHAGTAQLEDACFQPGRTRSTAKGLDPGWRVWTQQSLWEANPGDRRRKGHEPLKLPQGQCFGRSRKPGSFPAATARWRQSSMAPRRAPTVCTRTFSTLTSCQSTLCIVLSPRIGICCGPLNLFASTVLMLGRLRI